jgi:hypothetical protein
MMPVSGETFEVCTVCGQEPGPGRPLDVNASDAALKALWSPEDIRKTVFDRCHLAKTVFDRCHLALWQVLDKVSLHRHPDFDVTELTVNSATIPVCYAVIHVPDRLELTAPSDEALRDVLYCEADTAVRSIKGMLATFDEVELKQNLTLPSVWLTKGKVDGKYLVDQLDQSIRYQVNQPLQSTQPVFIKNIGWTNDSGQIAVEQHLSCPPGQRPPVDFFGS